MLQTSVPETGSTFLNIILYYIKFSKETEQNCNVSASASYCIPNGTCVDAKIGCAFANGQCIDLKNDGNLCFGSKF
jgi:hypothetical protein